MCILLSPGVSWTHPSLSCSLEVSKNQKTSSFCSTGGFRIWPKGFAKDDTGSPSCYRPLAAACSSSMCSKAGRGKKQWFSQCNFCQMALCLSCQHIPFKGAAPLNHLWLTSPDFCHFWKCPFPPWKRAFPVTETPPERVTVNRGKTSIPGTPSLQDSWPTSTSPSISHGPDWWEKNS